MLQRSVHVLLCGLILDVRPIHRRWTNAVGRVLFWTTVLSVLVNAGLRLVGHPAALNQDRSEDLDNVFVAFKLWWTVYHLCSGAATVQITVHDVVWFDTMTLRALSDECSDQHNNCCPNDRPSTSFDAQLRQQLQPSTLSWWNRAGRRMWVCIVPLLDLSSSLAYLSVVLASPVLPWWTKICLGSGVLTALPYAAAFVLLQIAELLSVHRKYVHRGDVSDLVRLCAMNTQRL